MAIVAPHTACCLVEKVETGFSQLSDGVPLHALPIDVRSNVNYAWLHAFVKETPQPLRAARGVPEAHDQVRAETLFDCGSSRADIPRFVVPGVAKVVESLHTHRGPQFAAFMRAKGSPDSISATDHWPFAMKLSATSRVNGPHPAQIQ